MATVDILAAFGYKWGQDGTVEAIDDAQYKAGWSFIGATPPSVEQFNKVHQIADEKANYLYAQMAAIFTAAGETPSAADLTSLRDALASLYGNGRLTAIRVISASATYTPTTARVKYVRVRMVGGGGGGGGGAATAAGQLSVGSGGNSGAYMEFYIPIATANGAAMVVGAAGTKTAGANGGSGGATSFGGFTAPGGQGGQAGAATSGAAISAPATNSPISSGTPRVYGGSVGNGGWGLIVNSGLARSGDGGSTIYGNGPTGTQGPGDGGDAGNYGCGGGGALVGAGAGARAGGLGAGGVIIIEEFE